MEEVKRQEVGEVRGGDSWESRSGKRKEEEYVDAQRLLFILLLLPKMLSFSIPSYHYPIPLFVRFFVYHNFITILSFPIFPFISRIWFLSYSSQFRFSRFLSFSISLYHGILSSFLWQHYPLLSDFTIFYYIFLFQKILYFSIPLHHVLSNSYFLINILSFPIRLFWQYIAHLSTNNIVSFVSPSHNFHHIPVSKNLSYSILLYYFLFYFFK